MLAISLLRIWNELTATLLSTGYALFNIEAELVAAAVIVIIFNHQLNTSTQSESRVYWLRLLFAQFLYCITSVFRVLVNIGIIANSPMVGYSIQALNFMSMHCAAWLAFIYVEVSQDSWLVGSPVKKVLTAIPLIIEAIIFIFSPATDMSINFTSGYLKIGPLFGIMMITAPAYYFAATLMAIIRRAKMSRYERDMTESIEVYPAVLFVVILIQALNWKIPIFCNAIMIADVYVYIKYSDSLVSLDPLTKILNRNGITFVLSEYLGKLNSQPIDEDAEYSESSEEGEGKKELYVIALDIDDLNEINSSYGRIDGDNVLIIVAEALKKFSEEAHDCYIARYYSDEFILVAEIESNDLEIFIEHVRNYIANAATAEKLPYYLRVNVGYAKYERFSKLETVSGLIEEATKVLNENKEQRKFQTFWQGTSSEKIGVNV